jgi:hypothetical protein
VAKYIINLALRDNCAIIVGLNRTVHIYKSSFASLRVGGNLLVFLL